MYLIFWGVSQIAWCHIAEDYDFQITVMIISNLNKCSSNAVITMSVFENAEGQDIH
jgi:hypothetical protein